MEMCPLLSEKCQKSFWRREHNRVALGQEGFPHYDRTLHLGNPAANLCFLARFFQQSNNEIIHFSKTLLHMLIA